MAASVVGAFTVLDRASRPIRKIRDEALKADAAVKKLGLDLDRLGTREQRNQMQQVVTQMRKVGKESGGAAAGTRSMRQELEKAGKPAIAQDLSRTAQSMQNVERASKDTDRSVGDMTRSVSNMRREVDRGGSSLRKFGGEMLGLRQALMFMLIPAIGLAAQGLGALATGVAALLPQLSSLAGLAAPLGAGILGIGTAAITVKLAFNDLGKALGGNKNAIKALTPEGKRFLTTLKEYQPVLQQLRRSAQAGLFPGLDMALRRLQAGVPVINQVLKQMGQRLGALANQAASRFTQKGFLNDFQMLAGQGGQLITRAGRGLLNLADAFRHLFVAAMPFTDWLSKTVLHWTKSADEAARLGRNTGALGDWFTRARASLEQFGRIASNVWHGLSGIADALKPLGGQLWDSIEGLTKRWATFSESTRGQGDMRQYFAQMRVPLSEAVGLLGDLVKGVFSLTRGSGFTAAVRSLRDALPDLTRGLNAIAGTFGPAVVGALAGVLRLFSNLGAEGGALTTVVRLFGGVVGSLNWMIEHVPGLGGIIGAALTVSLVSRFATQLGGLTTKWLGVRNAASQAAQAEAEATNGSALPGLMGRGVGGATTRAAMRAAGRGSLLRGALGAFRGRGGAFALAGSTAAMFAGSATGGGIGNALSGAGTGAALGATVGSVVPIIGTGIGAAGGAALGAALGFFSGRSRDRQTAVQQGQDTATTFLALGPSAARIRRRIGRESATANRVTGTVFDAQGFETRRTFSSAAAARGMGATAINPVADDNTRRKLNAELKGLHAALPVQVKIEHQQAVAQARDDARKLAFGYGQAFNVYSRQNGPIKAMEQTSTDVLSRLRRMGPMGRRTFAQNMLDWAREQAQQNPKLQGQVDALGDSIEKRFKRMGRNVMVVQGQILDGSTKQWQNIRDAIDSPMEQARERLSASFTRMQQIAVGALTMMGFTPGQARGVIRGQETITAMSGGKVSGAAALGAAQGLAASGARYSAQAKAGKNARGGRIPGSGLGDTVMVAPGQMAAPGELIANRHTERRVNTMLAAFGTSLGREVAGETRPHYAALGGRVGALGAGLQPGIAKVLGDVLAHYPGLSITSTTGGGHANGSYHYRGMAVDLGGSPALMNRAAAWIGSAIGGSLLEGIHNPNLSIKNGRVVSPGFWGAQTWAEHANHIHLAAGGVGALHGAAGFMGGLGMGQVKIRAPHMNMPGIMGAAGDRVLASSAAALQNALNDRIGAAAGLGGGQGTSGQNQALGRRMMLAAGWGANQWPALRALWNRESGWNANAVNASSGAAGIPQALGHGHVFNLGDARAQIAWGLNYIRGRYGSPAAAWGHEQSAGWYGLGGRLPQWGGWHARGGTRRYSRPTLIGVGEGGQAEDVHITPAGRGSGQTVLHIHRGAIVVQGVNDPEAAADAVMKRLTKLLRSMGLEAEEAMA